MPFGDVFETLLKGIFVSAEPFSNDQCRVGSGKNCLFANATAKVLLQQICNNPVNYNLPWFAGTKIHNYSMLDKKKDEKCIVHHAFYCVFNAFRCVLSFSGPFQVPDE